MEIAISGTGVLTHLGEGPDVFDVLLGEPPAPPDEEVGEGLSVPMGRIGLIRNHPFAQRYERFGQMDTFSRYAFIAAGHALDEAGLGAPAPDLEGSGVVYGTAYGCQEANAQFDQFSVDPAVGLRGASPLAFKGTVDNAPAGWSAVGYALRGVNATFVSGVGAGAEALLCARSAILAGRTPTAVGGGVERLIPMQIAALYRDGDVPLPFAAEGAAMVVLESVDAAIARGHAAPGRLLAAGRLGAPSSATLTDWLEAADSPLGALTEIGLAPAPGPRHERLSALAGGLDAPVAPRIEAERFGTMFAAGTPMTIALMVRRLARAEGGGRGLLLASGEGDEVFAFLVANG